MGKKKDRNASKDLLLRGFNCELLEDLKGFTKEKTGSKAIITCCSRYIMLENNCEKYLLKIAELEEIIGRMKELYNTAKEASTELNKLMQG